MKKSLSHTLFSLLAALFVLLAASPAWAQTTGAGKTGTIITFDGNSCKGMFAQDANTTQYDLYGYIRHKQAPFQVVSSNSITTNDMGLFTSMQNNIMFTTDGKLVLCRGNNSSRTLTTSYFGIVAPKGYRIMRLMMEVESGASGTTATAGSFTSPYREGEKFSEVNADGTETGKSITLSSTQGTTQTLDITKTGSGANKIYLSIYVPSTMSGTNRTWIIIKSLKITYAIDDPFAAQLPTGDGNTKIHTDMTDLGTFTSNSNNIWVYNSNNVTDLQDANLYSGDATSVTKITSPEVKEVDNNQYFVVASNGDYYVEAPEKFRIVGATVNFLSDATSNSAFTGTVYDRDGKTVKATESITTENTSATVKLDNLNNDAIHLSFSGLAAGQSALYNVNLSLLPLDPEVQHLTLAYKDGDDEHGHTTVNAENYVMATNENTTVYVPVKVGSGSTNYQIVFRSAANEQATKWYKDGTKDNDNNGYSNYFLVNSTADTGGNTDVTLNVDAANHPADRANTDQAGTTELAFTNIGDFDRTKTNENPDHIQYNVFDKSKAGMGTVTLTSTDGKSESAAKTVHVYAADMPTFSILPAGTGLKHIDYRYYTITIVAVPTNDVPVITLVPIYTSTLKGKNNKNTDMPSDKGETADTQHTFYGVKIQAKRVGNENDKNDKGELLTSGGVLSTDLIVTDLGEAFLALDNNYGGFGDNDSYRGVLYVDMSSLQSVENTVLADKLFQQTADNCLFFMYRGYQAPTGLTNIIAKQANGTFEATSNIIVHDQQPFFTPYDFGTGTHTASYTRENTNGHSKVKQMSVVLPFSIRLDGEGHPYSSDDNLNTHITFRSITDYGTLIHKIAKDDGTQGDDYSFAVVATPVTGEEAVANTPYHLITDLPEGGFSFNITNAKFVKTPTNDQNQPTDDLTNGEGTDWVAHGTFAGKVVSKADSRYIFSSGVYHRTGAQVKSNVVNLLPFRAYFDFNGQNSSSKGVTDFAVVTDPLSIVTGISDVRTDGANGLSVSAGEGFIIVKAAQAATVNTYTISGQQVAHSTLAAGESSRFYVPQGVYIVNGVKVVVK